MKISDIVLIIILSITIIGFSYIIFDNIRTEIKNTKEKNKKNNENFKHIN